KPMPTRGDRPVSGPDQLGVKESGERARIRRLNSLHEERARAVGHRPNHVHQLGWRQLAQTGQLGQHLVHHQLASLLSMTTTRAPGGYRNQWMATVRARSGSVVAVMMTSGIRPGSLTGSVGLLVRLRGRPPNGSLGRKQANDQPTTLIPANPLRPPNHTRSRPQPLISRYDTRHLSKHRAIPFKEVSVFGSSLCSQVIEKETSHTKPLA